MTNLYAGSLKPKIKSENSRIIFIFGNLFSRRFGSKFISYICEVSNKSKLNGYIIYIKIYAQECRTHKNKLVLNFDPSVLSVENIEITALRLIFF